MTTTLLSVEEFLALPESPGFKRELVQGELIEMPGAIAGHEQIKTRVYGPMFVFLQAHPLGEVYSEAMFVLAPHEAYVPDVSFLKADRLKTVDWSKRFQGAPDLAVEIVSSDSADVLQRKITGYLEHGARAVWVLYPRHKLAYVYGPDGQPRVLHEQDVLEEPSLLPGFQLPLAALFEGF